MTGGSGGAVGGEGGLQVCVHCVHFVWQRSFGAGELRCELCLNARWESGGWRTASRGRGWVFEWMSVGVHPMVVCPAREQFMTVPYGCVSSA